MRSESIDKLAGALSKAQSQIEGAKRDSDNPFFKSKYADLASVWDACKKQLTDNGLAIVQTTEFAGERLVLKTTLLHTSGQWVESIYPIITAKPDAQGMVAALTYARRASLAAIAGVCPIDDDGETAVGRGGAVNEFKPQEQKPTPKALVNHADNLLKKDAPKTWPDKAKISEAQAKRLLAISAKSKIEKSVLEAHVKAQTGSGNVFDIHPSKYEDLCDWAQKSTFVPSKQAIKDLDVPDFMKEDIPWDK